MEDGQLKIEAHIINAFVDRKAGGNPAGVVLDADDLSPEQKLVIAAKIGLSETAFVSSSNVADFKLEFFTPTKQIAHCGHATIATFVYLREIGRVTESRTSKETIDGNRAIFFDRGMAFMEQVSPKYTKVKNEEEEILSSLALSSSDLMTGFSPVVVSTGNAFLIVPLKNENAVELVKPDFEAITKLSEKYDLIGYYVFSGEVKDQGRDAGTRMFAPRYGIKEESATGMAAGPLACYLNDIIGIEKKLILIEQGHFMSTPSPSVITVKLYKSEGIIEKIMAGGDAMVMKSFKIEM
jgi:PhzF family phenazine biosynthesis protein